jgi:(p)ppGpp synthase/HD superfamily hydrolase
MLTLRFDEALGYASRIHRGQRRKGTATPYVSHLLAVSSLTLEHGGDEEQAIAALLHDAAEDQGGAARLADIRRRFGDGVAAIVADCTDAWLDPKPPWQARKEDYVASLPDKPARSRLVSLADKTHNARAILADLRTHGPALWPRFTGGRDGSLWYYRALADAFQACHAGTLADELDRTVAQMESLAG